MTRPITELRVLDGMTLEDLKAPLTGAYAFEAERERHLERAFLDTFDWRVYQAGGIIESTSGDRRGIELSWRKRKNGLLLHRAMLDEAPGFIQDFPQGAFRANLAPVLEMRRLLPLVRIESSQQMLRVLGDEDKTVVRVELERSRYLSPDGEQSGELGMRIHLLPVRGYDGDFDRVSRAFQEMLDPADTTLFDSAVQAIGRVPGDYSSKLNYRLDPAERCDRVTKVIHLGLLRTLETNIDGTRNNVDSEFLHDLRVATRRTRSALTQIKDVFPPDVTERFKDGFAWLGQITGPTRDMDVYLLALDEYKAGLPLMLREELEPLRDFLAAHHVTEQKLLARKLVSPQFRKLLKDWRTFLEAPVPEQSPAANAARPAKAVADERIWKMYRRVLKEGRAITDDSPPEDLHELRKSCKKLRYLIEFFQSLYAPKQARELIKVIKVLLDNLGNFQDLEVQSHTLRHFAEQMLEEGKVAPGTLLAMGALIGGLAQLQRDARDHFARIFTGFDTQEHRLLFKTLFKAEPEASA
jgi:CHAD domain-containing protein